MTADARVDAMEPSRHRVRRYRFSPWWINAVASIVLAATAAIAFAVDTFFGTVVALVEIAFLVPACIVATITALVLRRRIEAIAVKRHPGWTLFGALALGWIAAWLLGVFVLDVVAFAIGKLLEGPAASGGFDMGSYSPEIGLLGYGAPILAVYVVISAIVCARFRP